MGMARAWPKGLFDRGMAAYVPDWDVWSCLVFPRYGHLVHFPHVGMARSRSECPFDHEMAARIPNFGGDGQVGFGTHEARRYGFTPWIWTI